MHDLKPFASISEDIRVRGSITQGGMLLTVRFELEDPQGHVLDAPEPANLEAVGLERADGLWQTTCFEAFWGESGKTSYWELNLSPNTGKWNLYHFDDYRAPQPPRASHDYQPISLKRTAGMLEAKLQPLGKMPENLEARLCAVIRLSSGPKYFSTRHSRPNPDFHDRISFTVKPDRPV